ncbi:hypothetical protein AYO21_02960 [Fonsecaea monophora]|uniref:Acyl-CoA dehydrogenase n=1 Tax=Fonsecaea monophora TaxID=254056 RepID=A0A177FEU1_9EURO|nr:hypothetical protein AYO21_02960 [Fonsecaea monophora]OAG42677.1 hypothetical protein AYO21_02960 [Fonsecaea monophora]
MSLHYRVNQMDDRIPASGRIPVIARPFVERFVEEECIPADPVFEQQLGTGTVARFDSHPRIIEDLKTRAKSLGLWNLFLPKNHFQESPGFSNLEYGLMAEYLGKSVIASEATNCSAPDTGNIELLAKYGNEAQKDKWLAPLLKGEIRSAFLMTEPQVASSDATNIELAARLDGDYYILNGQKWWSSGAGDRRCKIYIVMAKTDPENPDKYKRQSVILVPADTLGITVHRMLSVIGFDAAPHGHGHISFNDVRVHKDNMVLGRGRGFEVVQGRLGPGRIHHAMRSIGAAERALEYFLARINDTTKTPFGKQLHKQGMILERVARSRIEIDSARLAVLNAAIKIDEENAKNALHEIAKIKVQVPSMYLDIVDRAIQAYGGAGVSQDTPLAAMLANARTMRIVDGPDEVHIIQLGRNESKRGPALLRRIEGQKQKTRDLLEKYRLEERDVLQLNRTSGRKLKL